MPAIEPQPRPWWRQRAVGLVLASVTVPVVLFSLLLTVAPPQIPGSDEIPALPEGLSVIGESGSCGSGGCYREWSIGGPPGASPDQLLEALGRPTETCEREGLLDFKQRCTGVDRVGDEVRLSVSVSEFW